jgi:arsenate reductase
VRKDKHFASLGLDAAACAARERVIELLLEHPKLMQRPIFESGGRAVIARPPEKLLDLL